ncbi:hypothetical protein M2145_001665 [Lachnospiraceae bacterium PF1-21]
MRKRRTPLLVPGSTCVSAMTSGGDNDTSVSS